MQIIKKPTGTLDILPQDSHKRRHVENQIREIFNVYNYREIRTPAFEKTELFKRGIGEETDIVSKEMYSFHNDEFTLRPEMTAPVIRSYIENRLDNVGGVRKLYYIGNMFRHERPQAGRYREFNQFGAEAIGSSEFFIDAEMICLAVKILEKFGLKNIVTKINTIGTLDERKPFLTELTAYLKSYESDLSETSKSRLRNNPLRILDTKDLKEKKILENAPVLFDFLTNETKNHFKNVLDTLRFNGIDFVHDNLLVRGFDYYTSTTFEILSGNLGAQNAVLGGGRYDVLVEELGGNPTPAIGFASGIERIMILLEADNYSFPQEQAPVLYIAAIGDSARQSAFKLVLSLRSENISAETDFLNRSVKAQMKEADRLRAKYSFVIGDSELETGTIVIRNMADGSADSIQLDNVKNYLLNHL